MMPTRFGLIFEFSDISSSSNFGLKKGLEIFLVVVNRWLDDHYHITHCLLSTTHNVHSTHLYTIEGGDADVEEDAIENRKWEESQDVVEHH